MTDYPLKKRGGYTLKVKTLTYMLAVVLIFLLATSAWPQAFTYLENGQIGANVAAEMSTWGGSQGYSHQWGITWFPNWQPWAPPGETDIGYHGVDRLNETHERNAAGYYAIWTAAKNWTSPPNWNNTVFPSENNFPVFVADNGPRTINSLVDTPYPDYRPPVYYRRFQKPAVRVDDPVTNIPTDNFDPDNPWTYDPDIPSDGVMEAKGNTSMGVTTFQRWHDYAHPDYDRLLLVDMTVTNSGDTDALDPGLEKEGQVLEGFWFGLPICLEPDRQYTFFDGENINGSEDYLLDYDPETRTLWFWDGDDETINGDDQFQPRGGPRGQADIPTGEYCGSAIWGVRIIHIDAGPNDTTDDPAQPATANWEKYWNAPSPVAGESMQSAWEYLTGPDETGFIKEGYGNTPLSVIAGDSRLAPILGFGPYQMQPNDDLHIVWAVAVGSIPEPRAIELGWMVQNGQMDAETAKMEVYTKGVEDLLAQLDKAEELFANDFVAPKPPDPPDLFIESGPERVLLDWDPVDGAVNYKLYHAVGGLSGHRVFELIYEGPDTEFIDEGLTRGFSYYYYVVAVDGSGLESSHFFTRVNTPVIPFREGLSSSDWAERVRVVPNPFNVKGGEYRGPNTGFNFAGGTREQNQILFVNLPEYCTINIYNSVGDLMKTLEHTTGSADEMWDPALTDHNQFVATGVYFYTIEVTDGPLQGEMSTGKLVIIR
jgi:hypothetical protein